MKLPVKIISAALVAVSVASISFANPAECRGAQGGSETTWSFAVYHCGSAGHLQRIVDMDPRLREVALLMTLACVCVGVASALDEGIFAALFAAEAAWAGIEMVRQFL